MKILSTFQKKYKCTLLFNDCLNSLVNIWFLINKIFIFGFFLSIFQKEHKNIFSVCVFSFSKKSNKVLEPFSFMYFFINIKSNYFKFSFIELKTKSFKKTIFSIKYHHPHKHIINKIHQYLPNPCWTWKGRHIKINLNIYQDSTKGSLEQCKVQTILI